MIYVARGYCCHKINFEYIYCQRLKSFRSHAIVIKLTLHLQGNLLGGM